MDKGEGTTKLGRPLKFQSVEELQGKIDEYFKSCWTYARDMFGNRLKDKEEKNEDGTPVFVMKHTKPYTITGLAVYLDTTRETLLDYESGKYDDPEKSPEINSSFSDTIKKAKQLIYSYAEESLFVGRNPAGAIFNLKNNWNWKDKYEHDVRKTTLEELLAD